MTGLLYPTRTRLALLSAVEAGDVLEGITPDTEGHTWLTFDDGTRPLKVCARIQEAERAGWVECPPEALPFWRLTDAGRAVLAAGER